MLLHGWETVERKLESCLPSPSACLFMSAVALRIMEVIAQVFTEFDIELAANPAMTGMQLEFDSVLHLKLISRRSYWIRCTDCPFCSCLRLFSRWMPIVYATHFEWSFRSDVKFEIDQIDLQLNKKNGSNYRRSSLEQSRSSASYLQTGGVYAGARAISLF